jgi:prevent-host-death family protein
MTAMSFYEARTHLSDVLDQVARGRTILITRRGKPAALLSPPPVEKADDVEEVIAKLKAYSRTQGRSLDGLEFREMIEEGRRL